MNIWIKSIAVGAVIGISSFFLSGKINRKKKITKYNFEYNIKASSGQDTVQPVSLSKIVEVLEKRLQTAEYEFKIRSVGKSKLNVTILDLTDTLFPASILTSNNRVQFRELFSILEVKDMLTVAIEQFQNGSSGSEKESKLRTKKDSVSKRTGDLADNLEHNTEEEKKEAFSLIEFSTPYQDETSNIYYPAEIGMVRMKDTVAIRELLLTEKVRLFTPVDLQICYGEPKSQEKKEPLLPLYFLKTKGSSGKALLENEDISFAEQDFDQTGRVEIRLQFNQLGTRKWATMTRQNIGLPLAIIINNTVISAPKVLSEIPDGSSSISGNYTVSEARTLCAALKSTKLPADLTILSCKVTKNKPNTNTSKEMIIALVAFIFFAGLSFFILKTLKSS